MKKFFAVVVLALFALHLGVGATENARAAIVERATVLDSI